MFGVDSTELLLVAVIALIVIGPKDLPKAMRAVGQFIGRARGMARHFRTGFDTMMREAELEEMEKTWRDENERIMREHPFAEPLANPASLDVPAELPPPAVEQNAEPPGPQPRELP